MQVPTVIVQREKSEENPSGLVVINESDVVDSDVVVDELGQPINATPAKKAK